MINMTLKFNIPLDRLYGTKAIRLPYRNLRGREREKERCTKLGGERGGKKEREGVERERERGGRKKDREGGRKKKREE